MSRIRWAFECAALISVLLLLEIYAAITGDRDMP
ncbi:hypothetical protein BISA_0815 [Bifidobacterium saguini DSM 23967]|uniref:Uncharacterized protein n=1 Tax=Bifidobacterium saguini DSM 23967 TaxID=1437607 RepID=A0A087DA65_9BIFI|nr:hypothetical protein BISA_0815 [Bifidobacterium saguini DSM 23967]